jgi:PHP family Zn ribbon phosphoesterase
MQQIGERQGITVIPGAEVTTREEIHCLVFFDNYQTSERFQEVIDRNLIIIPNRPECFGQQLIVDEMDNILDEEDRLLTSALELSIEETAEHVHALGGLLVPAHINRKYNALFSQLGFIPSHLQADALEVCRNQNFGEFLESHPEIKDYPLVTNSDAHCIGRIGEEVTEFYLEAPMFAEIKMALKGVNGRKVKAL